MDKKLKECVGEKSPKMKSRERRRREVVDPSRLTRTRADFGDHPVDRLRAWGTDPLDWFTHDARGPCTRAKLTASAPASPLCLAESATPFLHLKRLPAGRRSNKRQDAALGKKAATR
jgi:hypothetical protein